MYSYGLESLLPLEIHKWVVGNKWHADTFTPHVARIDKTMAVYDWYEPVLTVEGRGIFTCMILQTESPDYGSTSSLYVSIQVPPYEAHYPVIGNELWLRREDLAPVNGKGTFIYRGYIAFSDRFSIQAAGWGAGYTRFTGTVWYVTH
ncbi:hypothetical protein Desku_1100 [Desulfofundulus kuznetsovii DSM 6115]|uniref:Uncharacterized protein n=1 Tax=Desulfofundulus kuznetsovii (strain DSM 6115 / VKM B-1805 / 17) TaxID=760568 RepID=A0AAU8P9N1_DESK7|nr:hypothetical protein Desku_1100 [Desulfofundulus kuznetsovii DSM 6115]